MPHVKNALMRYRIIDQSLRSKENPFPSKEELRVACEEGIFGSTLQEYICASTIEKDLFSMRMEHDAPIKYSKIENGYYYTDKNYSIDNSPLSEKDIEALTFAIGTLSQFKGMDFYQEYGFALERMIGRIESQKTQKDQSKDSEFIQFETGYGNSGQEHINQLLNAISAKKEVWFDYQSFNAKSGKRRKVTPLLLKEYRNRWYLICYDLVKTAIMTFGLDRIENIEVSNLPAQHPKTFNPDYYFKHAVGITVTGETPVEVVLKAQTIASRYIESQPLHPSQVKIEETEKESTFKLFVLITEELIRTILSYGGEIEIVAPKILRKKLKERVVAMNAIY